MINLKEIYEARYYHEACSTDGPVNFIDVAILAMRDACNQTVDLCAENAKIESSYKSHLVGSRYKKWKDGESIDLHNTTQQYKVDTKSMLKLKDQIV